MKNRLVLRVPLSKVADVWYHHLILNKNYRNEIGPESSDNLSGLKNMFPAPAFTNQRFLVRVKLSSMLATICGR